MARFAKMPVLAFGLVLFWISAVNAQRIALVAPENDDISMAWMESFRANAPAGVQVMDSSMTRAAFDSLGLESPFNLGSDDARRAASVIGCEYFVLVRSGSGRRQSFEKGPYFESWTAAYLVSGRTGRLVEFSLQSFEGPTPEKAKERHRDGGKFWGGEIAKKLTAVSRRELSEKRADIEEPPAEDSERAKNFRPPAPYRRIKPAYTDQAFLYDVRGTVDIEADIDEQGRVLRAEAVRWAGYGLDESAVKAVRTMNWRPAERGGKPLPMRVLLRYNFTKAEKQ